MAKQIDRALLRTLREQIDAQLATIGKQHGVILSLGNARFTATEATFKMAVALTDTSTAAAVASGSVDPKAALAAQDYVKQCKLYGLDPAWLNKQFEHGGSTLTVVGLLPNKRVNNVLVEGTGGGRYIMKPSQVAAGFGK